METIMTYEERAQYTTALAVIGALKITFSRVDTKYSVDKSRFKAMKRYIKKMLKK